MKTSDLLINLCVKFTIVVLVLSLLFRAARAYYGV